MVGLAARPCVEAQSLQPSTHVQLGPAECIGMPSPSFYVISLDKGNITQNIYFLKEED